jgi:hypothetical protein
MLLRAILNKIKNTNNVSSTIYFYVTSNDKKKLRFKFLNFKNPILNFF